MKSIKNLLLACALVSTASGAVTISDTYASGLGVGPTDIGGGVFGYDLTITGFTAAGTDKLVLMYSSKRDSDSSGGAGISSISYGGALLTNAIYFNGLGNQTQRATGVIAYLDNVTTDGNLRIALDSNDGTNYSFSLFALNGTAAGVSDTASSSNNPSDAAVTVSTSSGFTLQEAARNNQNLAAGTAGYTTIQSLSGGSYVSLSQYQVTSSAGDYFAEVNNTVSKLVLGASFDAAAIPEPSTLFLVGLGSLILLRRRR